MAINFVGDNDHGNADIPLSVTLWAEITQLRQEVIQLTKERDEARLNLCDMYTRTQPTGCQMKAEDCARDNDWDCFKALDQHSESVTTSHKSIITKHNDLFQKLAQDEKTNG
jgi:hypothetical protein